MIVDESARSGLGVLCTNDPLIRRVTRSTILCPDICPETGWDQHFKDRREVRNIVRFLLVDSCETSL